MGFRRIVEEFEADLVKVPEPRFLRVEKGELERKKYSDGEEKLEIRFHGVKGPEGGMARVLIEGESVCNVRLTGGRGRKELSTSNGDEVPQVSKGSVAEIEVQGDVVLRGVFKPD